MSVQVKLVLQTLAAAGHERLVTLLGDLRPQDPTQALILRALADAIDRRGLEGMQTAAQQIANVLEGQGADLDLDDLRLASDLLAEIQRLEADGKSAAAELLARVSHAIVPLAAGALRLLVP